MSLIHKFFYYYLLNKQNNQALTTSPDQKALVLNDINYQSDSQIWMVKQFDKDAFIIVHCDSDLVLEVSANGKVSLSKEKNKNTQWFTIKHKNNSIQDKEVFWIHPYGDQGRILHFNKVLLCESKDNAEKSTQWQISQANKSHLMQESFIIQYQFSGQVLDVVGGSQKQGAQVCQYPQHGRCNQRWFFKKFQSFHLIFNVKSKMVLAIKDKKPKQNALVVQQYQNGEINQLWIIEEHGPRVYLIRSAMNNEFVMGIRDRTLKQAADLVIVRSQSKNFMRIIGIKLI